MRVIETALYSPDPQIRWEEARRWAQTRGWTKQKHNDLRVKILSGDVSSLVAADIDPLSDIPADFQHQVNNWGEEFAFCGSMNAWMTFVGPSPGGSPSNNTSMHEKLDSSTHHRNPLLGRPHPTLWYVDGAGFFDEIRKWVVGAYQDAGYFRKTMDEFAPLASFLMFNLVKRAYPRESLIPIGRRRHGAKRIWSQVMPVVRPGLIVALTRGEPPRSRPEEYGVFRVLLSEAEQLGLNIEELPKTRFQSGSKEYWLPRASVESADWGRTLLATVPTHPSYLQSWIDNGRIHRRSDVIQYLSLCVRDALCI